MPKYNIDMNWITGDWHKLLGAPWAEIALTFVAVFCGAVIGVERERKDKPTGTRTLTLVCLGSAVFTMASAMVCSDGKIAAQIVSGIGFLGAGAVIHGRFGVTGLTSAATIWAVAAIGMLVGVGYAGGGLALSLLILSLLTVISAIEQLLLGPCRYAVVKLAMKTDGGKTMIKVGELLDEFHMASSACTLLDATPESTQIALRYCCSHAHHRAVLAPLAEMAEITAMHREGEELLHRPER